MIRQEKPNFVASRYAPNPKEVTYWIDLSASSDGQIIKCYVNNKWVPINEDQNTQQDKDVTALENRCTALENNKVDKTDYNKFVTESITAHNSLNENKADKSTTLAGYGITDVYTKTQTNSQIDTKIAELVNQAPETLNTLDELAAALGDDPNFATTVTELISTKANSTNVYTKDQCNIAINEAITNANKVTSTDVTNIKVVSEIPTIQETGVLYIKIS